MAKKVGIMPTEVFWGTEFCFSLDNNEEKTTKNNLLVELNLQCFSVELSTFKKHLQQVCFVVPEDFPRTRSTERIRLYFFTHSFSQKC